MLQSNFEMYLIYGCVYLLQLALTNALWLGLAWYGWHLWRRARRQLADMTVDERAVQRRPLIQRMAAQWIRLLAMCVVMALLYDYWREVQMRRSAHDCTRVVANQDGWGSEPGRLARMEPGFKAPGKVVGGGLYIGEECEVIDRPNLIIVGPSIKYMGLLRVYDAKTGELLGREFVPMPDSDIDFDPREISQSGGDGEGGIRVGIRLPPTAWDRFKAWMP